MGQRKDKKGKIIFIYCHQYEEIWRDGLWAALQLLSYDYEITMHNLWGNPMPVCFDDYNFALGWGAFGSPVDNYLYSTGIPKGLCIGGVAHAPETKHEYDVLFYETLWYKPQIEDHRNIVHAFGVNTDIYKPIRRKKIIDYITVGAFSYWKRQKMLLNKKGTRLAIGEIQKGNISESLDIIGELLLDGVIISDMLLPDKLAEFYNMSKCAYIPANIAGGGERAVLEARACGIPVEVENDNPKLLELASCPIWDHHYYYGQLKKGIETCL